MGGAPDKKCDRLLRTSSPEPHVSSFYPVLAAAVPVRAGMMVAVPLELVASPLKSGRDLGEAERSALVIGGTGRVRTGDRVVFCKVVAVTEAQVKRDGQVRAKGSPVREGEAGKAPGQGVHDPGNRLDDADAGREGPGRDRGAGRGPGAGAVGAAVAAGVGAGGRGLAERARPGPPGRTAGPRTRLGLAGAPGAGLPGRGDHREDPAAEGRVAGRDAAAGPGHARQQGVLRVRRHRG